MVLKGDQTMIIRNSENFKSSVTITFKNELKKSAIKGLIETWLDEGHEIKSGGLCKSKNPKTVWVKFFNRVAANDFSEKIISLKNKNI